MALSHRYGRVYSDNGMAATCHYIEIEGTVYGSGSKWGDMALRLWLDLVKKEEKKTYHRVKMEVVGVGSYAGCVLPHKSWCQYRGVSVVVCSLVYKIVVSRFKKGYKKNSLS